MRKTFVLAVLASLATFPALAQPTPNTSGGGSTNGVSGAMTVPPTGSFAPAARGGGAGTAGGSTYSGTRTSGSPASGSAMSPMAAPMAGTSTGASDSVDAGSTTTSTTQHRRRHRHRHHRHAAMSGSTAATSQ